MQSNHNTTHHIGGDVFDKKIKKIVAQHRICNDAINDFFQEHPYLSVSDRSEILSLIQKAFDAEVVASINKNTV